MGLLISGIPPLVHIHTHVQAHIEFRPPQSTIEGGDVILSAAAPAEESSNERASERKLDEGKAETDVERGVQGRGFSMMI